MVSWLGRQRTTNSSLDNNSSRYNNQEQTNHLQIKEMAKRPNRIAAIEAENRKKYDKLSEIINKDTSNDVLKRETPGNPLLYSETKAKRDPRELFS